MHYPTRTTPTAPHTLTARQPLARTSSWLLACALGLALAACGGGGGGGDTDTGTGSGNGSGGGTGGNGNGGTGGGGSASGSSTFVAASGPLCAQRNSSTNNCVQPTSSAIEELALIQTVLDPNGPVIDFDGSGFIMNSIYSMSGTPPAVNASLLTSSYGMARRNVQAGRNAFAVDGRQYSFQYANGSERTYQGANDAGSLTFHSGSAEDHKEGGGSLSISESQSISQQGSGTNFRTETALWASVLPLLTDQAHAPREQKVTYVGRIIPMGGTGEQLNEHTTDRIDSTVTYEAVLDTATGQLSGVRVDYTDPESQRRMVLELPELRFENSRLDSASRMHRISAQVQGPGSDSREDAPLPDTAHTQLNFTLDGLEGEITGPQASVISIVGGGAKGILRAQLVRKDLLKDEDDLVIHIPLATR